MLRVLREDQLIDDAYNAIDRIVYDDIENIEDNMSRLKNCISKLEHDGFYSYVHEIVEEIKNVLCFIEDLGTGGLVLAYYHLELVKRKNNDN